MIDEITESDNNNNRNNCPIIYSIVSGKGGTGKSLIATSIAYVLAHCGKRVLLIDLDLFTHGLTFFALAEYPRRVGYSTSEIFRGSFKNVADTIKIPSKFVNGNLYLVPSISQTQRPTSELKLNQEYDNYESFSNRVTELISRLLEREKFDFILIDTRGGTDATSVGATLASNYYIIVTEADKPSWDMGRLLIDTINTAINERSEGPERIGFVINKNVLPSESIESFLRKEWQAPHLATIPLDESAVRYFQEDKVPTAESIGTPFSIQILNIIRKAFLNKSWGKQSTNVFEDLWRIAKNEERAEKAQKERQEMSSKYNQILKIYGTLISTAILSILAISIMMDIDNTKLYLPMVLIAAMLIFLMTAADPKFVTRLLDMFVIKKR